MSEGARLDTPHRMLAQQTGQVLCSEGVTSLRKRAKQLHANENGAEIGLGSNRLIVGIPWE